MMVPRVVELTAAAGWSARPQEEERRALLMGQARAVFLAMGFN